MVLKPQDLLVALAMALHPEQSWSLPALVRATGVSLSEVHAAVRRCQAARLLGPYRGESCSASGSARGLRAGRLARAAEIG